MLSIKAHFWLNKPNCRKQPFEVQELRTDYEKFTLPSRSLEIEILQSVLALKKLDLVE